VTQVVELSSINSEWTNAGRAPLVAVLGYDLSDLVFAVLFVVVALSLACFIATFGYLKAKRVAIEREMAEERELEAGGET
jgi:hypothetical protein